MPHSLLPLPTMCMQANGGDADPDLAALLQSEEQQQQQQGGDSPQAPAAEPLGSPQAPDMELEADDEDDYLAGYPPATAAAGGGGGAHVDPAAQAGESPHITHGL
jgi:hypothetical protein